MLKSRNKLKQLEDSAEPIQNRDCTKYSGISKMLILCICITIRSFRFCNPPLVLKIWWLHAAKHNMPAVALTDHANMMGAFHFVKEVTIHNKTVKAKNEALIEKGEIPTDKEIKPIVGCEFFVCEDRLDKTRKDNGYQIVFLAKTKKGYHNLAKLSSSAYTDGFYYVPRIDKNIIQKYKEDLIVLTGNLYGEVPSKVLNVGENQAEEALLWWKEQFGDDLYIELMRHNQEDENRVNPVLVEFSKKHNVKIDCHK